MTDEQIITFKEMDLSNDLLEALDKMGFKEPSPIQAQAIPMIQKGNDLIALAATGSGKTAACVIPLCDRVDLEKKHIQVLVLVPTRELALQYASETQRIGSFRKVSVFALFGGMDMSVQQAKLNHGVQVLVATPGRLIDCIYNRLIDLSQVETFILDEADEMLSMGFFEDIEFIFECLIHEHQTLLFSATMPSRIRHLSKQWLKKPQELHLNEKKISPKGIEHTFTYCRFREKEREFIKALKNSDANKSIIFCHSRRETEQVHRFLRSSGIRDVEYIHAGLDQNIRTSIIDKFRRNKIKHLIGTDVLARGMDFSGVTHVFIYTLSESPDLYVHRSGRTGRNQNEGTTLTFVTDKDLFTFNKIKRFLGNQIKWINNPSPRFLEGDSKKRVTHTKKENTPPPKKAPLPKRVSTSKEVKPKIKPKKITMIPPPKNLVRPPKSKDS